ncbi:MAG: alpha/beta hydrolase [Candidatus Thorarchaeota archaeon]
MSSENVKFKIGDSQISGILEQPNLDTTEVVLVLHPHPLYGGDMHNPVVLTLVNAFHDTGYATLRFDFRGVTIRSDFAGVTGAVDDCIAASKMLENLGFKLTGIAGYSFGGSTALRFSSCNEVGFLVSISSSLALIQEDGFQVNQLSGITCPVLMFHGVSDLTVPYENMTKISSLIGNEVKCVSLEKEGHFYHRSLTKVSTRVKEFIQNL